MSGGRPRGWANGPTLVASTRGLALALVLLTGPAPAALGADPSWEARLIELSRFVVGPGFTLEAVAERFGPRVENRSPRTVRFAPRDPVYRRVGVQTVRGTEPSTLVLDLARPETIDFGPLIAEFGEPELQPRVHPEDPVPWRFELPGGWLLLETGSAERQARYEVTGILIRRRPGG